MCTGVEVNVPRRCKRCGETKPVDQFPKSRFRKNNLCIPCDSAMHRENAMKRPRCEYSNYSKIALTNVCDISCKACFGYRRNCKDKEQFEKSGGYVK